MKEKLGLAIIIILVVLLIFSVILKNKETPTSSNTLENTNNTIGIDYVGEITKEIEKFKVKELLPTNINKIIIEDYLTTNPEPITETFSDKENILKFLKLINATYWTEEKENYMTENKATRYIILQGDNSSIILKTYGVSDKEGYIGIENGDNEKLYLISKAIYREILSFNDEKFYLHESELDAPSKEECLETQKWAFEGVSDKEKEEIQEQIRITHYTLEELLINSVRLLKEPTSPYWNIYITGKEMEDFSSGEVFVFGDEYCFNYTLTSVKDIMKKLNNETLLKDLELYCSTLEEGINNHDLSKCFEAHEILHDIDIWVIEYPVENLEFEPPDWSGLKTYFGKVSLIN